MKRVLLLSLMASGLMFGAHRSTMGDNSNLSGRDRIALETSSPKVHVGRMHHKKNMARTDRVTTDKTTINAFVPVGK